MCLVRSIFIETKNSGTDNWIRTDLAALSEKQPIVPEGFCVAHFPNSTVGTIYSFFPLYETPLNSNISQTHFSTNSLQC